MTVETPIDGERSRRVAEIVGEALELSSAERPAFLDAACGGDAALRGAVEALLAADRTAEELPGGGLPAESLTGSTLSHYRIIEQLGAGGMGEVYLAEDEKLGRRVALKVLPRELARHPERLARFRREARAVAALNHPHIVTIHSVEEARGVHFLTLELVDGVTLREKIVPGGLPAGELLRLALPLTDALAAAHAKGITHRDLKPANVMVSGDGRIKVLDFGIAKLAEATEADGTRETSTHLTLDGFVLGTVAYMSPEQVVGHPVDHRSDIFSLGVVLFELATGEHPFAAPSRAETMSKILRDDPVAEHGAALPHRLGQIIGRCLEKDPGRRYQDARELGDELRALQREIDEAPLAGRHRRPGLAVAAGLLIATLAGGVLLWTGRSLQKPPASAPAATVPARTGVAVLHFQNLTGDPQLDWLRTGLTEMLVTDLSQSPRLDVLGTPLLHQILTDLGALGDLGKRPPSFDLVRQVAQRADAHKVILGSYAQVGDNVLIAFQIEDAATGRILGSDRLQGPGGERLLSLVDALAVEVRRQLDPAPPARPVALQDVTTSSPAALRLYTEAVALTHQAKISEAIVLLERAVELDPDFALALAGLGTLHGNLGHQGLSIHYLGRAVAKAEHLPAHERSWLQGRYYARTWGTYGRAIESFREYLRLYPHRDPARSHLARLQAYLERYDEAIRGYETILAQGTTLVPTTTVSTANAYTALGRFEKAHRLLLDLAAREPDNWIAPAGLGWLLMQWGRLDEASAALARAAALRPGEATVEEARWRLAVLRQDWRAAEGAARDMAALDDPSMKWRGALSLARNAQFRGDFRAALEHLAAATRAFPQPDGYTAMAHCWMADLLLDLGEPARALAEAQRARQIAPGDWPELQGMFLASLAQQELGRPDAADALLEELKRRAAANPNQVEERQILRLEGRLALARGDAESAVASLRKAASLLPPQGLEIHRHVQPDHVPIWHDLGRAELAAGRPQEARKWLEKVAESGAEHIEFPVAWRRAREILRSSAGP